MNAWIVACIIGKVRCECRCSDLQARSRGFFLLKFRILKTTDVRMTLCASHITGSEQCHGPNFAAFDTIFTNNRDQVGLDSYQACIFFPLICLHLSSAVISSTSKVRNGGLLTKLLAQSKNNLEIQQVLTYHAAFPPLMRQLHSVYGKLQQDASAMETAEVNMVAAMRKERSRLSAFWLCNQGVQPFTYSGFCMQSALRSTHLRVPTAGKPAIMRKVISYAAPEATRKQQAQPQQSAPVKPRLRGFLSCHNAQRPAMEPKQTDQPEVSRHLAAAAGNCSKLPNLVMVVGSLDAAEDGPALQMLLTSLEAVASCPVEVAVFVLTTHVPAVEAAVLNYRRNSSAPIATHVFAILTGTTTRIPMRTWQASVYSAMAQLLAAQGKDYAASMHVPVTTIFQWDLFVWHRRIEVNGGSTADLAAVQRLYLTTTLASAKGVTISRTCGHPIWRQRRTKITPTFALGTVELHRNFLLALLNFVVQGQECVLEGHLQPFVWRGYLGSVLPAWLSQAEKGPVTALLPPMTNVKKPKASDGDGKAPAAAKVPAGLMLEALTAVGQNAGEAAGADCILKNGGGVAAAVLHYDELGARAHCGHGGGCFVDWPA